MNKHCLACSIIIEKKSKQWANQIYCTTKCRKTDHRKKKSLTTRVERRRANLRQNDEVLYLVKQCRNAGTVQILSGHSLESFIKTMELVRNRPPGEINLCHIAPVKGEASVGLFHHLNLFYGGTYQNKKFKNGYISGGLFVSNKKLIKKWSVLKGMSTNDVLVLIEKYLGDIIPKYIEACPVRKSKKVQIASKILEVDRSKGFEDLILMSYKNLSKQWEKISKIKTPIYSPAKKESKYITYMDGLSRFIDCGGDRVPMLKKLRKIMAVAYVALEQVEQNETYNKYFYAKYELLIDIKYSRAALKSVHDWSVFKDKIYDTVFEVLQGGAPNMKVFGKLIMSYLDFPE